MGRRRHRPRRRRQGPDAGKILWLVREVTGDLADALHRDLLTDHLEFDSLGWRGLWAYVTTAPPRTALHHTANEGWTIGDHLAAEQLYEHRKLGWRYTAVHFKGGSDVPFPEQISRPGAEADEPESSLTWENATLDDLIPPHIRDMLKGA